MAVKKPVRKLILKKKNVAKKVTKSKMKTARSFGILIIACGMICLGVLAYYAVPKISQNLGDEPVLGVTVNGIPANPAFSDPNFYACVLDNLNNYNIEGRNNRTYAYYTTAREMAALQTLSCNYYGKAESLTIKNTNGIELLTGLRILALVGSENIEYIDIGNNPLLTEITLRSRKLTSLDVSEQTQLRKLAIAGSPVSAIDIRKNTELTFLEIRSDTMSSIDISNNRKLVRAQIICKNITNIDFSMNTNLNNLHVGDANNNSGLTTIDVSNNIKLETLTAIGGFSEINLKQNKLLKDLYLYSPNITNIVLNENTALQYLQIRPYLNTSAFVNISSLDVTRSPELLSLECDRCRLANIDLSKNPKLKTLKVAYNKLTSLDITKNVALTYVNIANNKINSLDVSKNSALTRLILY